MALILSGLPFENNSYGQSQPMPDQFITDARGVDILSGQLHSEKQILSIGLSSGSNGALDFVEKAGTIGPPRVDELNGLSLDNNWGLVLHLTNLDAIAGLPRRSEAFYQTGWDGHQFTGPFYSRRGGPSTL